MANIRGGCHHEEHGGEVQAHFRRSSDRSMWGIHCVENRQTQASSIKAVWAHPQALSQAWQRRPSVDLSGAALEAHWGCHSGYRGWGNVWKDGMEVVKLGWKVFVDCLRRGRHCPNVGDGPNRGVLELSS